MYFQLNQPSIPAIRAKFLIETLQNFSQSGVSISLCATGRTGSGKTTLGNRLIGIDYFMPSTGRQDCTDEVNLVEFPIGLNYFDLPGVCSDDRLENYNRAALGLEQLSLFSVVDRLVLAKYGAGEEVEKRELPVSGFRERHLKPDLIFYLIAPDKQFLSVDAHYLRDLLEHYQQVIYVFNIFSDKESGDVFNATEQNIIDVTNKIRRVHHLVLGSGSQPIITAVNCWTGEGISDLIARSYEVLGDQKGRVFQNLIRHQQKRTPNEYLFQIKQELLRLFAHAACQKAEETHSCDQALHKVSDTLWVFLAQLRAISEQSSSHLIEQVNGLIKQVLANPPEKRAQTQSTFEEDSHSIEIGLDYIGEWVEHLNIEIDSRLLDAKVLALASHDQQIKVIQNELESRKAAINAVEEQIMSDMQRRKTLTREATTIGDRITYHAGRRDSFINEFNSLNRQIGARIDRHNAEVEDFNRFAIDLSHRIDRHNARVARWKVRLEAHNRSVDQINNSPYFVSRSTIDTIEEERGSLNRESSQIDYESTSLNEQISRRERRARGINSESAALNRELARRDGKEREIQNEEQAIDNLRRSGIEKIKMITGVEEAIQKKVRTRSERIKIHNEHLDFYNQVVLSFKQAYSSIEARKDNRIQEINHQLDSIFALIENYQKGATELRADETEIETETQTVQHEISSCLKNMSGFTEEINAFMADLERCAAKMAINKLVGDVIMACTTHHFDKVGECEYKGSTYQHFGQHGVALLLTLAHLIISGISGQDISREYKACYEKRTKRLKRLGAFPHDLTESNVQTWLKSKMNYLFERSFDEAIRKVAL